VEAGRRTGRRCVVGADHAERHIPGLVQRPGDDEVVPAEAPERIAEAASGVAVEERAGERRTARHAVPGAGRGAGAGEGTRRHHEEVLGRERIHLEQPLTQGEVRAQPPAAEPEAGDLHG